MGGTSRCRAPRIPGNTPGSRMMEAVYRYEGTVNQVMGDGIMALVGAPLAHEDHAVRACCAALRMQESVKKYAEEVRRSHAAVVKIRVGLNSGEVTANGHRPERAETVGRRRPCTRPRSPFTLPNDGREEPPSPKRAMEALSRPLRRTDERRLDGHSVYNASRVPIRAEGKLPSSPGSTSPRPLGWCLGCCRRLVPRSRGRGTGASPVSQPAAHRK
jgi:hypothetical protein